MAQKEKQLRATTKARSSQVSDDACQTSDGSPQNEVVVFGGNQEPHVETGFGPPKDRKKHTDEILMRVGESFGSVRGPNTCP